jgi:sarcosine oxidase
MQPLYLSGKNPMANQHYDVIVAGLGAMGSATLAHLAMRGKHVLGLERWLPGHPHGSSHGDSRIIREMYFEHPMYVPLVRRAHDLWRELEARASARLMQTVGGLMIGPEDGMLVQGTLRSAREHGLPYEILSASETARRYPAFSLAEGLVTVFDPRAGYLDPEACNAAHLKVASHHGAELRFEEPVITWNADGDGVIVTTKYGSYSADHFVLSVGARTDSLLPGLPLEVERQPVFWFEPGPAHDFDGDRFPIWAYEYTAGNICYGFPRLPRGVKAAVMHSGETFADADSVTRSIRPEEADPLRSALADVLPVLASAPVVDQDTCLFTNTPDHDFIIDFHPEHPQVLVSSPCSGHGFKFASAIGELQADLVTGCGSSLDLTPFSLRRFG